MNNKVLWTVIGAIVVIILIIMALMGVGRNGDVASTADEAQPASEQSLREIMASSKPVKCEYSDTQPDGSSVTGTTYISAGKVRVDFTSTANASTTRGHMVMRDNTTYTWIDGTKTGFKMSVSAMGTSSQATSQMNLDEKIDYKCGSWSADESMFTIPTTVTFTDMSAMFNSQGASGRSSGSVNSGSAQCKACDSAPASYQAQCRAQLCR